VDGRVFGAQAHCQPLHRPRKGVRIGFGVGTTKADSGIVCTGGTWYYGPGDKKGQAGGSMPDILIKGGAYFIR
jgi:hypothetical protein